MNKTEVDTKLKMETPKQIDFACEVLRVLHSVIRRMKMEHHRSWTTSDLLALLETLIVEINTGVTEEDKMREHLLAKGKAAFRAGRPRNINPYQRENDPQYYNWWDMGWHDGERQKSMSAGTAVEIHQGRIKGKKGEGKNQTGYRIQHIFKSNITEWNETLHQYSPEGAGTIFHDFEEVSFIAEHLKPGAEGHIQIQTVVPQSEHSKS